MNVLTPLKEILDSGACLVGMGNPLRQDDGLGVYIVEKIRMHSEASGIEFFNVEDIIESYVYPILNCGRTNVIIIDAIEAVDANMNPGTVLFGEHADFFEQSANYSTHKLALQLSCKILASAGKKIFVLGIVPHNIEYGQGLSSIIQTSADHIADAIIDFIKCNCKESVYV